MSGTSLQGREIRVRGLVQGVGFRPNAWRLARQCRLRGEVRNDSSGVLIRAWGEADQLDRFARLLQSEVPPLARIESLEMITLGGPPPDDREFSIVASAGGEIHTGVVADAATCQSCRDEIFDPANRRFRYPFTNCTHCGPRLTIIRGIPYDRPNTSMAPFPMCPQCHAEYADPADRRFHAQPNACPVCGPRVWLESAGGELPGTGEEADAISRAAELIRQGHILAIKGIGGIHLACDAGNPDAVDRLRQRKRRYHKAFALMARDIGMVGRYAHLADSERDLLASPAAPIVVLDALPNHGLAPALAPGQKGLGFMLPYSPLHHLLMAELERPVVLTSGNRSDEPQCIGNDEARQRLADIADYHLLHDREILNRVDDSVVRLAAGRPRFLRRARGYAPQPIKMPEGFAAAPALLAMGGELKNTFCLLREGQAILSQHMGDLEDAATHADYRHNQALYRELFGFQPAGVVVDLHPNYLSTQWGEELAAREALPLYSVQHHHAHVAACMAEQGLALDHPEVLGICLDGLGYGEDGTIWGGEFLAVNYCTARRLAAFDDLEMIGGAKAMYQPWRNSFAHLQRYLGWERLVESYGKLELVQYLSGKPVATLKQMIERGLNSPRASSAGRLFDAVAAALGPCRDQAGYEGQAAIELEALSSSISVGKQASERYLAQVRERDGLARLCWDGLWWSLLEDLSAAVDTATIGARFHAGLAESLVRMAISLCSEQGMAQVVLSGGVFQNRLLLEQTAKGLRMAGLEPLIPELAPANDGGIALGQVAVAAARSLAASA